MVDKALEQLIEDFDRDKLIQFYKQSSDTFRPVSEDYSNYLPEGDSRFEKIEQIGQIEYEKQAKTIVFFICPVSGELSEKDSKKKQYEIGKKILKDNYRDAGIFVFHGDKNFRLSLIAASYSGPKREFTTFRRYTYFVSPDLTNKTFKDQLKKCDFSSIEKILEAFSIEAVNKDFYTQIAEKFTELTGGWREKGNKKIEKAACMKLPGTIDETIYKEFAVRLIGRLIFCWFLKKKTSKNNIPLIPEGVLSTTSLDKNQGIGGYYHSILEPLFFEVLNTPLKKRNDNVQEEPWSLIPFLNGGLFTPHEHDFYDIEDTGMSKHINTLKIPDKWIRELLEIFERYNFTIDENTPIDVELSIEPEMLGRIFENLLAEIDPYTGETARKSTGSYYTPRAIVEYMVDESLKQYLLTKTGIDENKITELLSYADADEIKLSENQKDFVIQALHEVRIIDPACGSGAFPIGILQKILLVLQKLDPDSQKWLDKMLSSIPDSIYQKELRKKQIPNYLHKLGIIRDCIFGVDIQPIAVEISKLRCFLSLIVDEEVNDKGENRGIEHLPNLEFKFVCANTLVSLPESEITEAKKSRSKYGPKEYKGQNVMFEAGDKISKLKALRESYLTAMPGEKKKIEDHFSKVQSEMYEHSLAWNGKESQTLKLSQWNPFSDEVCEWFDPEWMFGIKSGFDIAIANPPYVNIANLDKSARAKYKTIYDITKNKVDLYAYFIVKGLKLTRPKGILSFIISHTWKATTSFEKLRKFLFNDYKLKKIVDLNFGVFDATVKPVVILVDNEKSENYTIKVYDESFALVNSVNIQEVLCEDEYRLDTLCNRDQKRLFAKIEKESKPISTYIRFSRGIKTSNDKRFIIEEKKNADCKKVYRGKNIRPYQLNWSGEFIWYRPDLMKEKVGCLPHSSSFFEVNEKIITQRVNSSMRLMAAYDDEQNYFLDTTNVSNYSTWDQKTPFKFICGLLNSKLINFYYCYKYRMPTIGGYELHSIPVKIDDIYVQHISSMVDEVISLKKQNPNVDTIELKKQIDQMIYKLYGLNKDEIIIVENSVK